MFIIDIFPIYIYVGKLHLALVGNGRRIEWLMEGVLAVVIILLMSCYDYIT